MNIGSLFPVGTQRREISRSDLSPLSTLQREIDHLFTEFTRGWPAFTTDLTPRMDVAERNGALEITAELPGLEEKDIEVTLVDDVLTIRGEKKQEKEEKDENRHLVERSYGAFSRSIQLPPGVAAEIKASLAKGVLTVTVPKPAQAEKPAKTIEVKAAA